MSVWDNVAQLNLNEKQFGVPQSFFPNYKYLFNWMTSSLIVEDI